jgi:hypothetical protein
VGAGLQGPRRQAGCRRAGAGRGNRPARRVRS